MSEVEPSKDIPIGLDDLVALNEEIAALVRAGVPLEVGLGSARGLPRKLRPIMERLRVELQQGATLSQALRACHAEIPPSYLALVEAGLRSHRLSDALVSASAFARALLDLQDHVRRALVYPLIVLCVGYGFFIVLMGDLLPRMSSLLAQTGSTPDTLLRSLQRLSSTMVYWGPALPVLVFLLAIWAGVVRTSLGRRPVVILHRLRWIPWMRRIVNDVQRSTFCQVLGILVDREIPLADALELSASASTDRRSILECRRLAAGIRNGIPLSEVLRGSKRLPTFMCWMLTAGQAHGAIPSVMQTLAEIYGRRARSRAEVFQMCAPLVLTVLIGGGAAIGYTLVLFLPMRNLLIELSGPIR